MYSDYIRVILNQNSFFIFSLQEQVLEDRHADLEFELRQILAKQGESLLA